MVDNQITCAHLLSMGNADNERDIRRDARGRAAARLLARQLGTELDTESTKPPKKPRAPLRVHQIQDRSSKASKIETVEPPPTLRGKGRYFALHNETVDTKLVPGRKRKGYYRRKGGAAKVELTGLVEASGNVHVSRIRELAQTGIITIHPPRGGRGIAFRLSPVDAPAPSADALPKVRSEAFQPKPRSEAILRALRRGRDMIERDLAEAGGAYPTRQVALHLGISPQAVHKKVHAGKLLAVPDNEGNLRFPAFQFTRPAVLPHLPEVLSRLNVRDPFVKLHWLLSRDSRIGMQRPVDLLEKGDVAPVLRAAEEYGEHVPA